MGKEPFETAKKALLIPIHKESSKKQLESEDKREEDSDQKLYICGRNYLLCGVFFSLIVGINLYMCHMLFSRTNLELDYMKRMQMDSYDHPKNRRILIVENTSVDNKDILSQILAKLRQAICEEKDFQTEKEAEKKIAYFDSNALDIGHYILSGHNKKVPQEPYYVSKKFKTIEIEPVIDESKDLATKVSGKLLTENYSDNPKGMKQKMGYFDTVTNDKLPVIKEDEKIDYPIETPLSDNADDVYEMDAELENKINDIFSNRILELFQMMRNISENSNSEYIFKNETDEKDLNIVYEPNRNNGTD